jgi:hypothetical protein
MRVIAKSDLIASAAERYRDAYQRHGQWIAAANGLEPAAICARLEALPHNTPERTIVEITGDARWTANLCDECGEDKDITVLFGEEIHHPTDSVQICLACLQAGLKLATHVG